MYEKIFNTVIKYCKWFLILDMVLIVVMVALQVISRYVFNNPTMWSEEVAIYALVYFTFLGNAIAISQKQMLKITIIPDLLPLKKRLILNMSMNVMSILLLLFVLAFSPSVFSGLMNYLTPALRIPKSFVFLAIPIGSLLMIMAFINDIREQRLELKACNEEEKKNEFRRGEIKC